MSLHGAIQLFSSLEFERYKQAIFLNHFAFQYDFETVPPGSAKICFIYPKLFQGWLI
ncbi:MAG: hypothetical protein RLZZ256_958 [Bacteroidota bacterium]